MERLSESRIEELKKLQQRLGYEFKNIILLHEATTHNSWLFDAAERLGASYERMEFLGDLVLSLIIGEYLFQSFPELNEADYSRIRSRIASGEHLSLVAEKLNVGRFVLLGRGEEQSGGRQKKSITSAVLEAIIAAVYLDSSLLSARSVVLRMLREDLINATENPMEQDYKSILQEYMLKKSNQFPSYQTIDESGPAHERHFRVSVSIGAAQCFTGEGKSKKDAQKEAARQALESLHDLDEFLPY